MLACAERWSQNNIVTSRGLAAVIDQNSNAQAFRPAAALAGGPDPSVRVVAAGHEVEEVLPVRPHEAGVRVDPEVVVELPAPPNIHVMQAAAVVVDSSAGQFLALHMLSVGVLAVCLFSAATAGARPGQPQLRALSEGASRS